MLFVSGIKWYILNLVHKIDPKYGKIIQPNYYNFLDQRQWINAAFNGKLGSSRGNSLSKETSPLRLLK